MNKKIIAVYTYIAEVTSIPLLILGLTYVITGYIMISSFFREIAGLIGLEYNDALYLHTERSIRISMISLALLHGYCGTQLVVYRYVKNVVIKNILSHTITILTVIIIALVTLAETLSIS
ncbi:MAG: hypothetical protein ABWJ42_02015 [Sulfolobales archaeon]